LSDFIHNGWSLFVAAATVLGLLACLALLIIAARRRVMAGDNTTGHVWDEDLRELNNPLPRWWMWLFVITVVFSAIYLAFYPGLGSAKGSLQWSSTGQYEAEQAKASAALAPVYARFAAMSADALAREPQAMAIGQRLFLNQCAQCHGSDARGSKGFPNLADDDWLGEHTLDAIKKTIVEGRTGVMPPMGAALGTSEDVKNVAHYVLSLSGSAHNDIAAQLGKPKFAACAACHGASGKGNLALGAPNLTDKVWLHGWGEAAIVKIINEGRTSHMPPQARLLTPEQVHVLAGYVLSLSRTTTTTAAAN
jgi:cytochrome c oxidase cbb3-type subunit III